MHLYRSDLRQKTPAAAGIAAAGVFLCPLGDAADRSTFPVPPAVGIQFTSEAVERCRYI